MLSKTCTKCGRISYSSSDRDKWTCPYCGENLSKIKSSIAKNN